MGKASADKKKKVKTVRVALIGCTEAAEKHMEALKAIQEVKVVAVCDIDEERLAKFKKKYKVRRGYTNYLKMIPTSHSGIDAVHVCLDDSSAALVASYCLLNKCNVMIEPPVAFDFDAVHGVVRSADYMGKRCAVVPPARSNALFGFAKDALCEGRLGQILSVRTMLCLAAEKGAAKTPDAILFGLLAPAIDLVDALVEDAVSGLSCSLANRTRVAAGAADSAEGVITYDGGVKHSFYYTGNYEGSSAQTAIVCEHGEILFEGNDVRITYEDGTKDELHDDAAVGGCLDAVRAFYEACCEGEASPADVHGALRLHEILLGLYADAMARGISVSKPPRLSVAGKAGEDTLLSKKQRLWY